VTYSNGMQVPAKVPKGKIFAMGDNREVSQDSRAIGFIDMSKIKGKVVLRIWPLNRFGGI
jgi:signal peptidase I